MKREFVLHEKWGDDSLSEFQHAAIDNELMSFGGSDSYYLLMSDFDALIFSAFQYVLAKNNNAGNTGFLLFINAHNHLRASARLGFSGQYLTVFPVARACLETAVYGWYLSKNPDKVGYWRDKHLYKSPVDYKKWNETFKYNNIIKLIENEDVELCKNLKLLHQAAIDFGAHPNKDALYSNLAPVPGAANNVRTIVYLHKSGKFTVEAMNFLLNVAISHLTTFRLTQDCLIQNEDFRKSLSDLLERVAHLKVAGRKWAESQD